MNTHTSSELLMIKNLCVNFTVGKNALPAVKGVNLKIKAGETVALVGESGSGKTVTALSITKLLPHNAHITSGETMFLGQDLLLLNEPELTAIRGKEIAYIFQEPVAFLNPVYTIGYQIMETLILHQGKTKNEAKEQTLQLLKQVQIKEPEKVFGAYPHQLSGGMNQRAFIAMSLACKPKFLIADEPTTSLDVTTEAAILHLLMDLKKETGFSLLFITHNLTIARRIADRICIMYSGKIVEEGERDAIFHSPQHFHTKELITAYEKIGVM